MVDQGKRITVITDPHIKVKSDYFVYAEGKNLEVGYDITGSVEKGAFIRDSTGRYPFKGECWPETSVWIDFLNKKSSEFWQTLYQYDKFKGTSKYFGFWVDMNEPSVFSGDELTLPKNAIHMTSDFELYLHKDLHNAYGILSAAASY